MSTEARKEYLRNYQKQWMRKRRDEWFSKNGPCKRCGSWDDLELDHIDPDQKLHHVVWSWSKERRDAELAKCQVLCHLCHKEKTRSYVSALFSIPVERRPHGTTTTYRFGCRCDVCTSSNSEARKLYPSRQPGYISERKLAA